MWSELSVLLAQQPATRVSFFVVLFLLFSHLFFSEFSLVVCEDMNDVNSGGGDTGLESNNTGTTTTITGRQLIHEDVDDDYYVPYSLRTDPLWADVTPLPQDDGEFTIARISYARES